MENVIKTGEVRIGPFIAGKVVNEFIEPVPYATLGILNYNTATVADKFGNFKIKAGTKGGMVTLVSSIVAIVIISHRLIQLNMQNR